jgi:hypothetical protein
MSQRNRRFNPALVIASLGLAASSALAAEPTTADLKAQIDALQAKVNQLESTQQTDQAAITASIQQVLADADKHSKMLDIAGSTAGYDPAKGLFIGTEDGSTWIHPFFQFQPRYEASYADKAKVDGNGSTSNGFEIRRMKFGADGNVFSKDLTFKFQWFTDQDGGGVALQDAWVKYVINGGPWAVRGGQFQDPYAHESLVGGRKLLSVERSYIGDILGNGDNYVQGITGIYDPNSNWRVEGGFTDGIGSQNTDFQNFPVNGAGYGLAGRFEYQMIGSGFKGYDQFTALNQTEDSLVFGVGTDYTETGSNQSVNGTIDASYQNTTGLSLYAAALGRYAKVKAGTFDAEGDEMHNYGFDYGIFAQAGYLFNPQWEVFGRYGYNYIGSITAEGIGHDIKKNVNEITAGVNYYIHGQACKISADVTYLPNGAPIADLGAGVQANTGATEVIGRVQFQLLI